MQNLLVTRYCNNFSVTKNYRKKKNLEQKKYQRECIFMAQLKCICKKSQIECTFMWIINAIPCFLPQLLILLPALCNFPL